MFLQGVDMELLEAKISISNLEAIDKKTIKELFDLYFREIQTIMTNLEICKSLQSESAESIIYYHPYFCDNCYHSALTIISLTIMNLIDRKSKRKGVKGLLDLLEKRIDSVDFECIYLSDSNQVFSYKGSEAFQLFLSVWDGKIVEISKDKAADKIKNLRSRLYAHKDACYTPEMAKEDSFNYGEIKEIVKKILILVQDIHVAIFGKSRSNVINAKATYDFNGLVGVFKKHYAIPKKNNK